MSTVNIRKSETDSTLILYDSFYKTQIKINSAEYDIVRSYFRSLYGNEKVADDFTTVIFQIANGYGRSASDLLDEMKGQDGVQVNATIAYYLNGLRSKATMLGVSVVQQPNYYAARNVQV